MVFALNSTSGWMFSKVNPTLRIDFWGCSIQVKRRTGTCQGWRAPSRGPTPSSQSFPSAGTLPPPSTDYLRVHASAEPSLQRKISWAVEDFRRHLAFARRVYQIMHPTYFPVMAPPITPAPRPIAIFAPDSSRTCFMRRTWHHDCNGDLVAVGDGFDIFSETLKGRGSGG